MKWKWKCKISPFNSISKQSFQVLRVFDNWTLTLAVRHSKRSLIKNFYIFKWKIRARTTLVPHIYSAGHRVPNTRVHSAQLALLWPEEGKIVVIHSAKIPTCHLSWNLECARIARTQYKIMKTLGRFPFFAFTFSFSVWLRWPGNCTGERWLSPSASFSLSLWHFFRLFFCRTSMDI